MSISVDPEWVISSPDPNVVNALCTELQCPPSIATILANRGIDNPAEADQFLHPSLDDLHDPFDLPDLDIAVDRIRDAIYDDERICVFADRDIDGVSGAAILVTLLEGCGAEVDYVVPGKYDGYGLKRDHVIEMHHRDVDLLVTVDAGTTAHAPIDRAEIDVIVTDHHTPDDRVPDALACVNPRLPNSQYPHEHLAGGAVAYKVCEGLVSTTYAETIDDFRRFSLPLAALATLGDYCRLTLENRAIVREGFNRIDECELPGVFETAAHCGVETMKDLSWSLIPLLNAAQEDRSGEVMLEVLLADEHDVTTYVESLEEYRDKRRRERREQRAHLEACFDEQCDPDQDPLFLIETDRYAGGMIAKGLSEEWGKPVVTYRRKNGVYQGGGRTDQDVDFIELFEECSDLLDDYWGHPGAAGFRLPEGNLPAFRERLLQVFTKRYDPTDLRPVLDIDARITPSDIGDDLIEFLDSLQPYGSGNAEPTFLFEGVDIQKIECFGREDQHCKLYIGGPDSIPLVYWNGQEDFETTSPPIHGDVVGNVEFDNYTNQPRIILQDHRFSVGEPQHRQVK